MFVEMWFIELLFYLSFLGLIIQTILAYKFGVFLGFHGTRLFLKFKRRNNETS